MWIWTRPRRWESSYATYPIIYLVLKSGGKLPETTLRRIDGEARVREVARMLSGDESDVSIAHARQMLADDGDRPSKYDKAILCYAFKDRRQHEIENYN